MHLETSLLAGIMIYNFKNYLRIVRLHRHHKKPVSRFFSATASSEKHFSLYKQIYMVFKRTPWFKASMNSIAFLLLRLEILCVINTKVTVNFTELKNKMKFHPIVFPFWKLLQGCS